MERFRDEEIDKGLKEKLKWVLNTGCRKLINKIFTW